MAVEVQRQRFDWEPSDDDYDRLGYEFYHEHLKALEGALWRQHTLHDLESFYWITVYIILRFRVLVPNLDYPTCQFNAPSYRDLFPSYRLELLPQQFPPYQRKRGLEPYTVRFYIEKRLPQEYRNFGYAMYKWCLELREAHNKALEEAYPGMEIAKLGKNTPVVVEKSMMFLGKQRQVVEDSPILQGPVEYVKR